VGNIDKLAWHDGGQGVRHGRLQRLAGQDVSAVCLWKLSISLLGLMEGKVYVMDAFNGTLVRT
jgi:hypothetical protein